MNFAGFQQGFNGASSTQDILQKLQEAKDQQSGNALLSKILAQYAGGAQATPNLPSGPAAMGAIATTPPGMGPQIGGVSPPMQGPPMPPAMGAPGGAGPSSPMGGAPMNPPVGTGGIDMQKLVQALASSGGSNGAQGYALKDMMKILQPQANNAIKLDLNANNNNTRKDIAGENINSREKIADDNRSSRERIADANRQLKNGGGPKLKDDPIYRALEDKLKAATSANGAASSSDHDATYAALLKASDDLNAYAKSKTQTDATGDAAPAAGAETVSVISPDGTAGTIPASQFDDAIKAGYKKAP